MAYSDILNSVFSLRLENHAKVLKCILLPEVVFFVAFKRTLAPYLVFNVELLICINDQDVFAMGHVALSSIPWCRFKGFLILMLSASELLYCLCFVGVSDW